MDDEEVDLLLAKSKVDVLEARNYVHVSHFLLANTLMSAAPVAMSYINIAWNKC